MTKSRNQREGYYAGWRRLLANDGHQRTGLPTESNGYFPALRPLPKRKGKRRVFMIPGHIIKIDWVDL